MDLSKLLRKNIAELKPYSSARDEYAGEAMVFLDANENPFNEPYNRYPDPLQRELKQKISKIKDITPENIFLGNGSDEPIDLLIRAFCEPGTDNIITFNPTYGMYEVAAGVNNVEVKKVSLTEDFEIDVDALLETVNPNTKLIFLCSPNNPTGNSLDAEKIQKVIDEFDGIVVLDEAYIDFAPGKSFFPKLNENANLVILQTFSKAWGMAGIRLGMAFASVEIVSILNKIKYPYNLNILTQTKALELVEKKEEVKKWVKLLIAERAKMADLLKGFPFVVQVHPSDANFLLIKMHDAKGIYHYLVERGIIVRNRSNVHLCDDSLRITIGSSSENETLLTAFKELV
ncbi:histidinol-phosphate transaminase [Maribellus maritimus]|uniref:histidinol-phosphate transaminase n=1 Tax=Maribellus maritimus TaxID=2870838 RepID=UPI001EECD273|nr:histidinol-phosphate transaminase [Maribellus maritimus]MCG6189267.1 histidinol-phosphate transaminase [Maribellus maritimus]